MKKLLLSFGLLMLAACGSGDSSSGAGEPTMAGSMIPEILLGTYTGTVNLEASALGLSKRFSYPITVTVTSDGVVRIDGDDPGETGSTGITDAGDFVGSIEIVEDDCSGTISVTGKVDGVTATGTVSGSGTCSEGSLDVDVELTGDFNATK